MRVCLSFFILFSMWGFQLSLSSRVIPSYFAVLEKGIYLPSSCSSFAVLYELALFLVNSMTTVFPTLNSTPISFAHSTAPFMAFWASFMVSDSFLLRVIKAPLLANALQWVFVFYRRVRSLFTAQFYPKEGDRIPPCGEPMTRVTTTVLSDRVHEHLLFVRYCLYMLHTFCLTPCFFMALEAS
jgi:hypothetical protein